MLRILSEFGLVFDDIFVTTCDIEAMHPNIKTEEGLVFMIVALDAFSLKVNPGWPRNQLVLAIILLLKCNVFQLDDACFR